MALFDVCICMVQHLGRHPFRVVNPITGETTSIFGGVFADDANWMAHSPAGLVRESEAAVQSSMDASALFAAFFGLKLVPKKCIFSRLAWMRVVPPRLPRATGTEIRPRGRVDRARERANDWQYLVEGEDGLGKLAKVRVRDWLGEWSGPPVQELSPEKPWRYLGVFQSILATWIDQDSRLRSKIGGEARAMSRSCPSQEGAFLAGNVVLRPQMVYPLKHTVAGRVEIEKVDSVARSTIKRCMRLCRSFPNDVFHGWAGLGGVGFRSCADEVAIERLATLLKLACIVSPYCKSSPILEQHCKSLFGQEFRASL